MLSWTLSPEYTYEETEVYKTQQTSFESGYVATRAYWARPKRKFNLNWHGATQSEKEAIVSFFRDIGGPAGAFLYTPPEAIASPNRAGDPAQASSGSLLSRTYYFAISWVTAQGETLPSPVSSFLISANNLFTLRIPKFPFSTITKARIYVWTASNALKFQTEMASSNGLWTEPITGLISGAVPPTANTAKETVQVHLMEDSLSLGKVTAVSYEISLVFEEMP